MIFLGGGVELPPTPSPTARRMLGCVERVCSECLEALPLPSSPPPPLPRAYARRGGCGRRVTQKAPLLSLPPLASQSRSTPLFIAAQFGHAAVVEQLIAARADIESRRKARRRVRACAHAFPPTCSSLRPGIPPACRTRAAQAELVSNLARLHTH